MQLSGMLRTGWHAWQISALGALGSQSCQRAPPVHTSSSGALLWMQQRDCYGVQYHFAGKVPVFAQVWSLDVDAAEQQLAVGGVSPQLQLYRIHANSAAAGASSASKQARSPAVAAWLGPCCLERGSLANLS